MTVPTIRVLGTGSRWHTDRELIETALMDTWHDAVTLHGPTVQLLIRDGACPEGADEIMHQWAVTHAADGVLWDRVPADWDNCGPNCPPDPSHRRHKKPGDTTHPGLLETYCPDAGPRRNADAVSRGNDLCLGFPLGRSYGTRNCMKLARSAGIPVREVTR